MPLDPPLTRGGGALRQNGPRAGRLERGGSARGEPIGGIKCRSEWDRSQALSGE